MFFRKRKTEPNISDRELAVKIESLITLTDPSGAEDIDIPLTRIEGLIEFGLISLRQEITENPGIASQDMLADLDLVISARERDGLTVSMVPGWVLFDLAIYTLDIEMDNLDHYGYVESPHEAQWLAMNQARANLREANVAELRILYDITLDSSGDAIGATAMEIMDRYSAEPSPKNAAELHEYAEKIKRLDAQRLRDQASGRSPYREKAPF